MTGLLLIYPELAFRVDEHRPGIIVRYEQWRKLQSS